MDKFNYSTDLYPFREVVEYWFEDQSILPIGVLPTLHYEKNYELFERENDQSTVWHKCFYKKIRQDDSFQEVYTDFLHDIIKPRFEEEIVYQVIPTFRVHLPNNIAVGEFHKDKHYNFYQTNYL